MSSNPINSQLPLYPPQPPGPSRVTSGEATTDSSGSDSPPTSTPLPRTTTEVPPRESPPSTFRSLLNGGNVGSSILFLLALAIAAFVMARMWKRNRKGRGRGLEYQVGEVRSWADAQLSESSTPLASAPREMRQWHVEIEQIVRDARAELDTKIVLLQAVIRSAAQEAERLERAIEEAKRRGIDT